VKKDIANPVSRRALLNVAIRSSAGAGILAGGFRNTMMAAVEQTVPAPRGTHEMNDYTADTFVPHVGQTLTFDAPQEGETPARSVRLQLLEVRRPQSGSRPAGFREPFSLMFAVADGQPSEKGLHRIAHTDFAPCDWLLTRVHMPGRDPRMAYYEAVFG
jgi:hypothetical protein